jgi:serine phosphatase RsbU (regulator of sigma subunit)/anti-sigma regulatory factor (Ser/Thr protein kinase)
MNPWLNLFRARLREPADLATIVRELEQTVQAIATPHLATLWADPAIAQHWPNSAPGPAFDSADPLVGHCRAHPAFQTTSDIDIDSAVLAQLDAFALIPLVCLGEFIGVIALVTSRTAPEITAEQAALLEEIAGLAASALCAARLTQQIYASELAWQTNAEELRVAEIIQRSLLPASLPAIDGWRLDAYYKPARVVGGDLYDFIPLPGDLLGIVLGDASDKSVPAALVMATVRTLIRAAAQRVVLPGQVLAQANDDLCSQIPAGMFVTCFFAILDTSSGRLRFANAGHCVPYVRSGDGITELRASGWPLGMLPGKIYDEGEIRLAPGSTVICFSDGLTETHDPAGEMFGEDRVRETLGALDHSTPLMPALLAAHQSFAGPEWNQEDDLTLVSLTRLPESEPLPDEAATEPIPIVSFMVPSAPDCERAAADQILAALAHLPLTETQRNRLHTASAEAVMNAAEHGNHFRADRPVGIDVQLRGAAILVRISDNGRSGPIPEATTPNIDAKLSGVQSPRGWGLFLIEKMVDQVNFIATPTGHTVELTINLTTDEQSGQ